MIKITDFLSVGEDQAISLPDLAAATGMKERSVMQEILNERLSGELIVSSDSGYFLPSCTEEIRTYVIKRKAALKTISAALRPFIKAIKGSDQS